MAALVRINFQTVMMSVSIFMLVLQQLLTFTIITFSAFSAKTPFVLLYTALYNMGNQPFHIIYLPLFSHMHTTCYIIL